MGIGMRVGDAKIVVNITITMVMLRVLVVMMMMMMMRMRRCDVEKHVFLLDWGSCWILLWPPHRWEFIDELPTGCNDKISTRPQPNVAAGTWKHGVNGKYV